MVTEHPSRPLTPLRPGPLTAEAAELVKELEAAALPLLPQRRDHRIGVIGAGFIVKNCHLVAYRKAGFNPVALSSRSAQRREELASEFGIPQVYEDWRQLADSPEVEVVDIAVPPHVQLEVARYLCEKKRVKGILCQKPLALSVEGAREIAELGRAAGIPIAVNSNMRYDPSMRALKHILDRGLLGEPVLASIDMRAIPDWQPFLREYDTLELYSMGIHHIDVFRYLFGDPQKITAVCRKDPRTTFEHTDGITQYTFQYESGLLATSLDDVWAWPGEPCEKNNYIRWRVEGIEGFAEGELGWHKRPPEPAVSTLRLTCKAYPHQWIEPRWTLQWFPDAFVGTMASLLRAVESGREPELSAADNVKTIACVARTARAWGPGPDTLRGDC